MARARSKTRWVDRIHDRLPGPAKTVVDAARGDDILLFASGMAFYALVSIVPLAIMTVWVLSLVLGDPRIHQLVSEVRRAAPKNLDVGGFIQRVADLGTSLGVAGAVVGIVLAAAIGFAGTAVGVALIYRIFPLQRMPLHAIVHGTLWSATTITVLTVAFGLVLQSGANFRQRYATSGVAALVLLAVWLFLANALLLVGYKLALRDTR